jgi:hypothetical protein
MNKDELRQLKKELERINSELLVLHKEGLPIWNEWFKSGRIPICGVQASFYMSLYPQERKRLVSAFAEILKKIGKHKRVRELKEGISEVFTELIRDQKAIGGPISFGSTYFWQGLMPLVTDALNRLPTLEDDSYIDDRTADILGKEIVEKDDENDFIRTIDEYRRIQSLDEKDRVVILDWKKGFTEREIKDRHSIPKTTIHDIIDRYRKLSE